MKTVFSFLAYCLFLIGNLSAQTLLLPDADQAPAGPQASLMLAGNEFEIGVPVEFTLTLPQEFRSEEIKLNVPKELSNKIQVLRKPESQDKETFTGEFIFLTDELSTVAPFTVEGTTDLGEEYEMATSPISMSIESPAFEASSPDDYTEPDAPEFEWQRLFFVGLAGLAGTIVLGVILFFTGRKIFRSFAESHRRKLAIGLKPYEELETNLRPILSREILENEGMKFHYTSISISVRRFVERAYDIQALEMTDDEMEFWLSKNETYPHLNKLQDVFIHTSLAKFANFEAAEDVVDNHLDVLKDFQSTEQELEKEREFQRAEALKNTTASDSKGAKN